MKGSSLPLSRLFRLIACCSAILLEEHATVAFSLHLKRRRFKAVPSFLSQNRHFPTTSCSAFQAAADPNKECEEPAVKVAETTIAVCTGADCRVDGASDCIRRFQQHRAIKSVRKQSKSHAGAAPQEESKTIAVKARPCLGPCGDGPNVVVYHPETKKRVYTPEPRPAQPPKSLVPQPAIPGIYQVRTSGDVDFIVELALDTAGIEPASITGRSAAMDDKRDEHEVVVSTKRAWYDRDRHELSFAQRIMWVSIALGWSEYTKTVGEPGTMQYLAAGGLFGLSLLVSKSKK